MGAKERGWSQSMKDHSGELGHLNDDHPPNIDVTGIEHHDHVGRIQNQNSFWTTPLCLSSP